MRRGASKIRVTVSSGAGDSATFFFAFVVFLFLQLAQILFQAVEALIPEAAIVVEPIRGVLERTRREPAWTPLRLATTRDKPRALEHLQMLGDSGQAHLEGLGEFGDRGLARCESS